MLSVVFVPVTEPIIHCERLDLYHLAADDLLALHENPEVLTIYPDHVFRNPHRVLIAGNSPVRWRAPRVIADPSSNKWFIRWMVLREAKEIIGSVSFHDSPDENGMLEIGLGVHEKFQRQGFALEALMGMWRWAGEQSAVRLFRYTVSPSNVASVALIHKLGFTYVGQQIDEEDGPEDIYEMTCDDFRTKYPRK